MKDVKLNYQTDKVYVCLALDDPKEDIHERYLYVFKSSDFQKFLIKNGKFERKLDVFKIKMFMIEHRLDCTSYPYTMDEMYKLTDVCLASAMSYDVQSV